MSLKEGATKRRELMKRRASCQAKASWSGRRVKKVPMEGTRSLSLDGVGWRDCWCAMWSD